MLRIAFVNNMPDAAFDDTCRQFLSLIEGDRTGSICVEGFCLPTLRRSPKMLTDAPIRYRAIEHLYAEPPDAVIVTGAEPTNADLTREPYWSELAQLIGWCLETVPSTVLSCLAAHSALFLTDQIGRRPLGRKCSGVYSHRVLAGSRFSEGMGSEASIPHSRWNDVDSTHLEAHGYKLLVSSPVTGWSVALREQEARVVLLLQGHPEYSRTTLLKEYRRDVLRYLRGERPVPPSVPENYLDDTGRALLESFSAKGSHRQPFPFAEATDHIAASWIAPARRLFANWVDDAFMRAASLATS